MSRNSVKNRLINNARSRIKGTLVARRSSKDSHNRRKVDVDLQNFKTQACHSVPEVWGRRKWSRDDGVKLLKLGDEEDEASAWSQEESERDEQNAQF
ncbi:hypothetical protein KFK09_028089 [Dendrobium nobile]|uniref:Uncharacterized protein n=1 Tax=Dendrobium nobile TaxID=94219 RepID=A0A8T3A2F6_DENNO|nr:hypothetical protein KFK09_028089 [Dendrobium nobile]